jgi:6-phosphogluconolactonase
MKYSFSFLLILSSLVTMSQQKDKTVNLLVGTYTKPGKSEGIYVYTFNVITGELTAKSKATGVDNPSFLAISRDKKYVYAANETSKGMVSAFSFDSQTGALKLLNQASSGGDGPCYVSTDDRGKSVYVGNYGSGSLSAIPLNSNGSLGDQVQTIQFEGKGVKSNQEKPHIHAAVLSRDNHFLFVPDLGTDKVYIYKISGSGNKTLSPATPAFASVDPGSGPRHLTFDQSGHNAFLIQEMTGVVTAFTFGDGHLSPKQSISLAPAGFNGRIDAADIHVSPDGKYVYASLRGDINEIVALSIDRTGLMTYVGRYAVQGKTPRNFAIDPTGNFLLVANQNSDEIVVFKRDAKTGALHETGIKASVGAPVCLLFSSK